MANARKNTWRADNLAAKAHGAEAHGRCPRVTGG